MFFRKQELHNHKSIYVFFRFFFYFLLQTYLVSVLDIFVCGAGEKNAQFEFGWNVRYFFRRIFSHFQTDRRFAKKGIVCYPNVSKYVKKQTLILSSLRRPNEKFADSVRILERIVSLYISKGVIDDNFIECWHCQWYYDIIYHKGCHFQNDKFLHSTEEESLQSNILKEHL